MSKVQILRASVQQRLTAAVEEIFGLFEKTITEYEEELCRFKQENQRQQKILDTVFKPQIRIRRTEFPADVQQLPAHQEKVPPEQQESSSLDQNDTESPRIKEEEVEVPTSEVPEQLQGPEGADIHQLPFTPLKREDHEENLQSSQLHHTQARQVKTEVDGEDRGGPEVPQCISDKASQCVKQEACKGMETQQSPSGSNLQNNEIPVGNLRRAPPEKQYGCIECGKKFGYINSLRQHLKLHTGENPFTCPFCDKGFLQKQHLTYHVAQHTGERPYGCFICGKKFIQNRQLMFHMASHTGEFGCSVCGRRFPTKATLKSHTLTHTKQKPLSCTICGKVFLSKAGFTRHTATHTSKMT